MIDVTRMPQTGALDFAIACAGAPAGAFGVLAIGARPDRAGSPLFGATFHLSTSTTIVSALVRADGLGAVEFPLPLAPGWRGAQAFAQFLFPNGTGCAPTALGASHGLELTIQ